MAILTHAGTGSQVVLKCFARFSNVVPQASEIRPISGVERRGESAGLFGGFLEVFDEFVLFAGCVLVTT
jgi:hypothetical protein